MYVVGLCALGVFPPAQAPGRTSTWEFAHELTKRARFTITVNEDSVTEQWSGLVLQLDGKVTVLLADEPLPAYLLRRCAELEAEGWTLRLMSTAFDDVRRAANGS
ncbi:hypothetical protein Aph01nite_81100 [Acrocarpospora phusangensis]|uniref:Uncharacterized protein n=1 Tax=Acrocarpospora phusangensis TaxID=1070424 RepID=A0A919QP36_9ACTN|nr:hypothetical protein [Acrocarpospora phusangensis]GIH29800.1 hypothetical protein Aph01nite_81100 [Acrocarpospora phusangensis]